MVVSFVASFTSFSIKCQCPYSDFETEVLFEVLDDHAEEREFDAQGGVRVYGGRYEGCRYVSARQLQDE